LLYNLDNITHKKGATYIMSTTVATPTQPLTRTETFDIAFGLKTKTDKDGNPVLENGKQVTEAEMLTDVKKAEELSEKNLFAGTTIQVRTDYPSSWDGLLAFAEKEWKNEDGSVRPTEDVKAELVKLLNNGASGKVMNRLRAIATKQDEKGNFVLTGDVVDLTNEITSGSKRVFLTEEQKAWKSLSNLPAAIKDSMWKAYLSATGKDYYVPAE
jgi:hypothetical protein